eukprot:Rmarinus@m.24276
MASTTTGVEWACLNQRSCMTPPHMNEQGACKEEEVSVGQLPEGNVDIGVVCQISPSVPPEFVEVGSPSLDGLCEDLVYTIASYMSGLCILRLGSTCRYLFHVLSQDCIWKKLFEEHLADYAVSVPAGVSWKCKYMKVATLLRGVYRFEYLNSPLDGAGHSSASYMQFVCVAPSPTAVFEQRVIRGGTLTPDFTTETEPKFKWDLDDPAFQGELHFVVERGGKCLMSGHRTCPGIPTRELSGRSIGPLWRCAYRRVKETLPWQVRVTKWEWLRELYQRGFCEFHFNSRKARLFLRSLVVSVVNRPGLTYAGPMLRGEGVPEAAIRLIRAAHAEHVCKGVDPVANVFTKRRSAGGKVMCRISDIPNPSLIDGLRTFEAGGEALGSEFYQTHKMVEQLSSTSGCPTSLDAIGSIAGGFFSCPGDRGTRGVEVGMGGVTGGTAGLRAAVSDAGYSRTPNRLPSLLSTRVRDFTRSIGPRASRADETQRMEACAERQAVLDKMVLHELRQFTDLSWRYTTICFQCHREEPEPWCLCCMGNAQVHWRNRLQQSVTGRPATPLVETTLESHVGPTTFL